MQSFREGKYTIDLYPSAGSERVCWISAPFEPQGMTRLADEFKVNIAVVKGMVWDDDLTPWSAPNVPASLPPFAGHAREFMDFMLARIVPSTESRLRLGNPVRILAGISLSGLFALWCFMRTDCFHSMISVSGSFWYSGFVDWLRGATPAAGSRGAVYLSLGVEEPHASVPVFATVGKATEEVADILRGKGFDVTFQWNPGNHYSDPLPRLRRAFQALAKTE